MSGHERNIDGLATQSINLGLRAPLLPHLPLHFMHLLLDIVHQSHGPLLPRWRQCIRQLWHML